MSKTTDLLSQVDELLEHINPHRPDYCTDIEVETLREIRSALVKLENMETPDRGAYV